MPTQEQIEAAGKRMFERINDENYEPERDEPRVLSDRELQRAEYFSLGVI